jgi:glycerophosphoryl diester phosphodiesterase
MQHRSHIAEMKVVLAILIQVLSLALTAAELPASRHEFVVIAHRGNHTHAHENTLTAIERAVQAGVDYVELDVRRTSDGQYVLMHDSTVDRTTDGHGSVVMMTLAQLQELKVRDLKRTQIPPERVPSFKEALAAIKGRINLYLDFKAGDRVEVANLIREAKVTKQILVYDGLNAVEEWRRVAPELPLIISPPQSAKTPELLRNFVVKSGIEVLDGSWKNYAPEMVAAAHLAGAKVWPDIQNGLEDSTYFASVVAVGFGGVQTDHPEDLIAWLTQQHRR